MCSKKKKTLKVISLVICLVLIVGVCCYFAPKVFADVGNNNRYESSSSSSSSSSDDGNLFFLFYFLFDVLGPIPALIIIAVGAIIVFILNKNGKLKNIQDSISNATQSFENSITNVTSGVNPQEIENQIRAIDPAFSKDAFVGFAREVFVKIQQAWSDRNWKIIRPFESNELFSMHSAQLQEYIDNNKINKIEKINVNYCELRSFTQDGDKEVLVVELHAIMRDYVVDANTNKVLESDPNKDWNMKYLMTFNRKAGVKTKEGTSLKQTTNCPNCGAPTNITSSGQCNYCDSVITTGEHDWVLSDIHSIK